LYSSHQVILREHFRCAPEIISFSNSEFYNGNLFPLRLPTSAERLYPSLIDVRLPRGRKTGKVNEQECDEIVRMIKDYVDSCPLLKKRSIGVISLVGDEQSRLIRGRLLDSIGPFKYKLHDILVGEPPSFQGAERDIVFLSLVCSPGNVVTQSQLMHAQRMNVALSRARDRMVLVRSIDTNHISNEQDIKFSVLDFFERARLEDNGHNEDVGDRQTRPALSPLRSRGESLLVDLLRAKGFSTRSMGVVWDNAICVENASTVNSARAALCVEAIGESHEEWKVMLEQQKSIERVGWKCLRVDALSFLSDHRKILDTAEGFLESVGVHPRTTEESDEADGAIVEIEPETEEAKPKSDMEEEDGPARGDIKEVVVISSDEDGDMDEDEDERKPAALPIVTRSSEPESLGNGETASDYGDIADLNFLRGSNGFRENNSTTSVARAPLPAYAETSSVDALAAHVETSSVAAGPHDMEEDLEDKQRAVSESRRQTFPNDDLSIDFSDDLEVTLDVGSVAPSRSSKSYKRRRTRLDNYSRDGRWYPSRKKSEHEDDVTYEEYIEEVLPEATGQTAPINQNLKDDDDNYDLTDSDSSEKDE
jgi:hypothetical protein